ncbi:MAG: hypothetical protein U1E78_02780 [Gammaproteobacteria bacterium]
MIGSEIYKTFESKKAEAEIFLASFGNDNVKRNAAINNVYLKLYKEDPTFIWFAAAVLGSEKVGQNLQTTMAGSFVEFNTPDFEYLHNQLSDGNQKIFTHMISRYLTFKEVGMDGLNHLRNSKYADFFGDEVTYKLFEDHSVNSHRFENVAFELGLSKYDPRVIEYFMLNQSNLKNTIQETVDFMKVEQGVLQDMYTAKVVDMLTNPLFVKIGEQLGLTGVQIDGVFYSFAKSVPDPANQEQREEYFTKLIETVGQLYQDDTKLSDFLSSVEVAALRSIFNTNPYKDSLKTVGGIAAIDKFAAYNNSFEEKVDSFIRENTNEAYLGFYGIARPEIIEEVLSQSGFELSDLDLKALLNSTHTIAQFNDSHDNAGSSSVEEVNLVEAMLHQDLYISMDLSDTNYQIVHPTRADFRASPYFTAENMNGSIVHWGKGIPWMAPSAAIVETPNGKIFYYDMFGLTKGITFPMMIDASTNTLLTVPVDRNGNYSDGNTIDIIKQNINLFGDTGDIVNNNALKLQIINNMAHQVPAMHNQAAHHAIAKRLDDVRKLNLTDVIKTSDDSIQGLDKAALSNMTISNASLEEGGKMRCLGFDGNTVEVINPHDGNGDNILEMCFPKNGYYWEQL